MTTFLGAAQKKHAIQEYNRFTLKFKFNDFFWAGFENHAESNGGLNTAKKCKKILQIGESEDLNRIFLIGKDGC